MSRKDSGIYKRGGKYVVQWTDECGQRRSATAPTKEDAKALKASKEREVFRAKHGVIGSDEVEFARWAAVPLRRHLGDWKQYLANKGGTAEHVERYHRLAVDLLCTVCGWERVGEVDAASVKAEIYRRHPEPWSLATCNHAVKAVRGFSKWLQDMGRTSRHRLAALHKWNEALDRRRVRGVLSAGELERVILAADRGEVEFGMPGTERGMFYRLYVGTGLRPELYRSLVPSSFHLDGERPFVLVPVVPGNFKQGAKVRRQPIQPGLALVLRAWLAGKVAGVAVFELPHKCSFAKMWRRDLVAAQVPEINAAGEVRDFYAVRHTYVDLVRRAGDAKAAQVLAGHSSARMTLEVYSHAQEEDLARAIAGLPVFSREDGGAASALQSAGKVGLTESDSVQMECGEKSAQSNEKTPVLPGISEVGRAGFEPATHGFSVHCSTN